MRKRLNFDNGWRFHPETAGETEASHTYGAMYVSAKTERIKAGPGAYRHFDIPNSWDFQNEIPNDRWYDVRVPHDYIITQTPDRDECPASGFFHYYNAWYRKHFSVRPEWNGKRIVLHFDGVTGNSAVYLNGCLIKYNHCGYTPFDADISDYVRFDAENVVAVYVDVSLIEGWWYRGAGIYRHVYLDVTDKVCVDTDGDYIYPLLQSGDVWKIPVRTTLRNDSFESADITLIHHVLAPDGGEVLRFEANGSVPAYSLADIDGEATLSEPLLWDTVTPYLYTLVTEVVRHNDVSDVRNAVDASRRGSSDVCDTYKTRFGFRTVEMTPDRGLLLNGKPVKIKGVCSHQDFGLTGIAVPDNIYRKRIELLREMGANGYRCSHYPHSPETMDALDENGFLVLDELRHFDSNEESMKQIEVSVKRDRNRPSVIFWSTGNEELYYHNQPQGIAIQRAMAAQVRKFDCYRPVTSAVGKPENSVIFPYVDIIGINYSLHLTEGIHERFPDKAMVSTENCAVGTTYGNYNGNHPELGRMNGYDADRDEIHPGREGTWKFIASHDWLCGGYQWDAFEHRGEAAYPRLCSASGAIDLFLQKKDAFYQNQSHWSDRPMIHLLPHWTFPGFEGRSIAVWAYTNCDEVEISLNGVSLGRKKVEKYGHAAYDVCYEAGCLTAVGYRDGVAVCRDEAVTAGRPYALRLAEMTQPIHAGLYEMAVFTCTVVDRDGHAVPNCEPVVRFEAENAVIAATGSSSADGVAVDSTSRKMYAGRISVGVTSAKKSGRATVYAYADGLRPAICDFTVSDKPNIEETVYYAGEKIVAGHV